MGIQSYIKIAPIPVPEASHPISKVRLKLGNVRPGTEYNLSLKLTNVLSCLTLQVSETFFLTTSIKGAAIIIKYLTNQ